MNASDRAQRARTRGEAAELVRMLSSTPGLSASSAVVERFIRQNESMASLITMLVRRIREYDASDKVAASAMAFLLREGLPIARLNAAQLEIREFAQPFDMRIAQPFGDGANTKETP